MLSYIPRWNLMFEVSYESPFGDRLWVVKCSFTSKS
jgi:hypothetical protein